MGRGRAEHREVWLTACTAVLVPTFLALGYWQLTRALSGNTLSWAYVFEWPLFAGYLIYVWWRLRHEVRPERPAGPAPDVDDDTEELAAYNRYLAALEESGRRKHW